jgi:hypothetical protein
MDSPNIANIIGLIDITNACVLGSSKLLELWGGEDYFFQRFATIVYKHYTHTCTQHEVKEFAWLSNT